MADGGGKISVADNPLLILASRVVSVIGVPIALGFFWLVIQNFDRISLTLADVKTQLAVLQTIAKNVDDDLDEHKERLDRLEEIN